MEAAPPRAKRSRREAQETQQPENPAPAAGKAADREPTIKPVGSGSQEPPPPEAGGDGRGGGVDRISGLPDAILGEIVSLLSTKEAARTQILASRWRHVWRASPLVLDATDLAVRCLFPIEKTLTAADEALASAVSLILSAHPGPGRLFCVQPHHLHVRPATVDAWLRSPALDNLQELHFLDNGIQFYFQSFEPAAPPESTFRFSATLRAATFSKCQLLDSSFEGLHFPHLKQLAFEHVSILEGSLHRMISSCPVLECLLLNQSFGFTCVRISSSSLRSIGVGAKRWGNRTQLREIIIADAPCLERLLFLRRCAAINVSVIAAPKLEACCLGNRIDSFGPFRLMFGTTTIEGLRVVKLTTVVGNVKILAVNSWNISLDMVIGLMKCFPCLEKLYVKGPISRDSNRWCRKHRQFIKFFDIRLKTIVLEEYRGINPHVNFASFFLLNATKLELMTLVVQNRAFNEAFFTEQYAMLQMEKRASRSAQLHFTMNRCDHEVHVNHVRDLAITDPFECRC